MRQEKKELLIKTTREHGGRKEQKRNGEGKKTDKEKGGKMKN